jgi:type I restriction enzyme S subunit
MLPPLAVQKTIADYLDIETARIDALIAKKRRMIELLKERASLALVDALAARGFQFPTVLGPDWSAIHLQTGWKVMHLNQVLLQLTNGYVGPTRDILVDDGIRYVQSLHIKAGKIDFSRGPFYVSQSWHDERPRIHLREGDVLIVQTGDIGQVAVVPEGFGEASCHALQIARVRRDLLTGGYLAEYLRTPFGYQSLLSRATGALHPHLEGGIRDVPIIVPPRHVQNELVSEVEHTRVGLSTLCDRLTHQIDFLVEHRQALITSAVTGELPIPGVVAA